MNGSYSGCSLGSVTILTGITAVGGGGGGDVFFFNDDIGC
jgi:hypothetical protein